MGHFMCRGWPGAVPPFTHDDVGLTLASVDDDEPVAVVSSSALTAGGLDTVVDLVGLLVLEHLAEPGSHRHPDVLMGILRVTVETETSVVVGAQSPSKVAASPADPTPGRQVECHAPVR